MTRKSRPFWNRLTQAMTAQTEKTDAPQRLQPTSAVRPLALEQRFMFDGAAAVDVAHAATDAATPAAADHSADTASALRHALTAQAQRASEGPAGAGQRQEVVFVDSQVSNIGELLAGLASNTEVVILDAGKDGLQQMADYLQGREGLNAIHLLSHGADGTVQLGNVWLSSANLAEHSAALQSIGGALKADGDLMLYGCDVGQGDKGQAFLDRLAAITGADVAASADDTGAAILGGNWTLERNSGVIETAALGAQLDGYQSLMAVNFSGGTHSSLPTTASGTTMRYVIGDFNNDGINDILFQNGTSIGAPWLFSAGRSGGTFETAVAQSSSPFANVTLIDAAAAGYNYYAADFDGDGDIDLLGVTVSSGPAWLYRNTGGTFTREAATGFNGTEFGVRLVVGDFNGDGAADILYQPGNVDASNTWRYAVNNGNGTFTDTSLSGTVFNGLTLPSYTTYNYRVVDFDGDGDLDIFAFVNSGVGTLFRNNFTDFASTSIATAPLPQYAARALIGDFDGDGDADIYYQAGTSVGAPWMYAENLGNDTFATAVAQSSSPFSNVVMTDFATQNVRVADMDGDGDVDVVGTAVGQNFSVFFQSGSAPKLVSATPADNSLNVSPGANIVLTFSESVAKGTGNIYIVRTSDNAVVQTIDVASGQVTGSGTTWTIDSSELAQGTAYAVRIDSKTFRNADGKIYTGIQNNTALNFTTSTVQVPVISNLNGDSVNYTEDAAYTLLDFNGNATVSDADSSNFSGGKLTVRVTAGGTAVEDVLFIRNQGNGTNEIQVDGFSIKYNGQEIGIYTGGTGGAALVITLTSNANATSTAALVHNLAYRNSNTIQPSTTPRSVSISMDDGAGGNSAVPVVNLAVLAVNDAPVVNATGTNPTYTENGAAVVLFSGTTINTVETGQLIKQMVFTVSGLADGSLERLTIDGSQIDLVSGTNVVTRNNATTVTVSMANGTAVVTLSHSGLASSTAQTIVNSMNYHTASEGPTGWSRVVTLSAVTDTGGLANAGSETTSPGISSVVTLVSVNDAPTLSGGPYVISSTNENTSSTAVSVSTLMAGATYADADSGAATGIAVTATAGRGTWQYSTDGVTWTAFGTVSTSSALLLDSSSKIRYIPDSANGENVSITFRAWDRTSGAASSNGLRYTGDTTASGGTTAYSTGTVNATMIVTSVNDAPVITPVNPTMGGLTDSSTHNNGDAVSTLLGGVTDVDVGALKGMAVTGITGTYGKWQFSTNNGTTWKDIGVVSDTGALLLSPSDRLRFVPDGIHGETATITYRSWDQTADQGSRGTTVNVTSNGGASGYSSATDTATVVIVAVNDRPVVTPTGTAAIWSEANNALSDRIVVDSGVTLSDPDGPNPLSATVRLLTYYSSQDSLAFVNDGLSMGNIAGSWSPSTGIMTLTSEGNSATAAQFQAAMRAVTYGNSSDSPNTMSRTVQFQVTDGGGLSSIAVTRDITIVAVNDSPTINAPVSQSIDEDIPTALGSITFSDVDSTLAIATFSVGTGTLSATGSGGVTVGGTATALTLTGTLANINQFIASNRLVYTSAANASGDVTLTIYVNTSSVLDATTTMTLQVQAVNDAPMATVPPSITVTEDVSSVITGISFFDVDAGTNRVTATLSVQSGTLSASTGMGVTVGGSGTGLLTLTGSLSDINVFIAANGLTFKTAQDATASVILTVNINDGGFGGSGGAQTDTKTVILNVTAVNDVPVNNVPGVQTASQNILLGFNTASGNAISISDVDAGNGLISVSLSAVNGLLSLGSLNGIIVVTGTGLNDVIMSFQGRLADVNAALQTLTFRPQPNYLGAASVTIVTNDNGNSGTGGAKSDIDTISINVIPVNPKVTNVSAQGLDRTVKVGDDVLISMTWDQVVNVDLSSGLPTLLLETGLLDRNAVYVSGTGTNTLVFRYTVQAGDISADLDFQSTAALQLNGAVIRNNTSDLAILTLPTVGGADSLGGRSNIVVDGVVPVVASVTAPSDGTYIIGQNLDFTVNFSESVVVDTTGGVPRIAVTLDTGGTVYAHYIAGSGGSALVFRLTVASGQLDANGVSLGSSVQLNSGSIRDTAGNAIEVTLNSVASTANVNIDGVVPAVVSVTSPVDGNYKDGDVLTFTLNASEALQAGSVPPRLVLDVGGVTRYATYVFGSGSAALVFQYVVQAGDNDNNGIAVNSLDLRGGQLTDLAGNDISLSLNGVGSTAGVVIDTTAPTATHIVRVNATPTNNGSVSFTVSFSEDVSGVDVGDFSLTTTGTAAGSISSVTAVDAHTYTVVVGGLTGIGSLGLDLKSSGTGIVDSARNAVIGGLTGDSYTIDRVAPSITGISVPSNGTYVAGQILSFTVNASELVHVTATPSLELTIGGTIVLASYVSGSGSNALVFEYTVQAGDLDSDGVAINGLKLNGGRVQDAVGNDLDLTLNAVGATTEVKVDAMAPTATIVVADTALQAGESTTVTITFSEAVNGFDNSDLSVNGGSLSAVSSSDGGITWTATLTPTAGITDTSNVITLNNTGYADAVGNSGTGTTVSNGYAIDTLEPVAPKITLDQATLVDGRQASPTGLVFISGLEAGGSWQYSLDNGASWLEGRGTAVQLPGIGAFSLLVQQRDAAGNASTVTSLNGIVEPPVPPTAPPPGLPGMNDLPTGFGLAPFQASEVSEPNADFLRSTSTTRNMLSQPGGMHGSESWSGYGAMHFIAGINDWMGTSLFAPAEVMRSGFDPVLEQFSVPTGASTLDLKSVLLASDSPWDIASLRFSFDDRQELPGWVRLDRQTGQLTIHAPKDVSTTLVLQIKVSDGYGHESVRTVKVVIGDVKAASNAPAGRAGLGEKMANAAKQQAGKRLSIHG